VIEQYDVRPPNADAEAESLSGGNQQKFIVGREFERDPELVVAMHPTRGSTSAPRSSSTTACSNCGPRGRRCFWSPSKLDEVQGLSDRLAVIHEGEFTGVVDPATVTEEEIGLLMAGETLDDDSVEGLRSQRRTGPRWQRRAWRRTPGQMIPSRRQMTTLRTRRWTRESHQHRV